MDFCDLRGGDLPLTVATNVGKLVATGGDQPKKLILHSVMYCPTVVLVVVHGFSSCEVVVALVPGCRRCLWL